MNNEGVLAAPHGVYVSRVSPATLIRDSECDTTVMEQRFLNQLDGLGKISSSTPLPREQASENILQEVKLHM